MRERGDEAGGRISRGETIEGARVRMHRRDEVAAARNLAGGRRMSDGSRQLAARDADRDDDSNRDGDEGSEFA